MRKSWTFVIAVSALGAGVALAAPALKITLAGGSVGGAWSTMGTAIGETIRLESPGSSFSYEPGVDAANVQLVSNGKVQLGITHAQMALRGIKGDEPFKSKTTDIKALALLDPQAAVQILVAKESKIQGLAQIKQDKMPVRLAFNKRGTMMAVVGEEVFKAAGITPADIAAYFHKLTQNPNLKATVQTEKIHTFADGGADSGLYTFSYTKDGKEVRVPARFTFVFHRTPAGWLIVSHHSSVVPPGS